MTTGRASDIETLLAEFEKSGLRELYVKHDELEIYLSADGQSAGLDAIGQAPATGVAPLPSAAPPATPPAAAVPSPRTEQAWPADATLVRAPYLGTFYRSPKPGSPPFVEQGGVVGAETELCLVEVMKLFTVVRAGVAGKVFAVLAADGDMVVADQPLFVVVPA